MVKIFISYRRADSNDESRRIYDALVARFGEDNIFRDKDRIPKGSDFRKVIEQYVFQSDEMLVLIGQKWLDIREDNNPDKRRLDNPEDFVRIEIELGLRHCQHVTPVVLQNTNMPGEEELPRRLVQLGFQNAYFLRPDHFESDLQSLVNDIAQRHNFVKPDIEDDDIETDSHLETKVGFNTASLMPYAVVLGMILIIAFIASTLSNMEAPPPTEVAQVPAEELISPADATLTAIFALNAFLDQRNANATAQAEQQLTVEFLAPIQTQQAQEAVSTEVAMTLNAIDAATAQAMPTNTPQRTATNTPQPTVTNTPELLTPLEEALQRARDFTGTQNSDWTPFEHDFDGVTMVLVPAGCFMMGSDSQARYWDGSNWVTGVPDGDEQCFDEPFWIDKYEVTQAQFASFGGTKANNNSFSGDNRPVENITWFEARDFCALRNAQLPTEAEWEYAARGLDELYFPWGNDWDSNKVVWNRSSSLGTADVGSILAGASWVGALDMSGNVGEWTGSIYEDYPYVANDGRETDLGNETDVLYTLRGGSWYGTYDENLRSANRFGVLPFGRDYLSGFRCLLSYE